MPTEMPCFAVVASSQWLGVDAQASLLTRPPQSASSGTLWLCRQRSRSSGNMMLDRQRQFEQQKRQVQQQQLVGAGAGGGGDGPDTGF